MKLYVARHGETDLNALDKICGAIDIPLTERGIEQAQQLAANLAGKKIDVIIASTMIRAQQTAAAISEATGIPVVSDERLVEQNFGVFEGLSRQDPEYQAHRRQIAYRYQGGESTMDVAARVYGLLNELKVKYADKNVLLVCHGCVCRVIRSYFESMTTEEFLSFSEENAKAREYEL